MTAADATLSADSRRSQIANDPTAEPDARAATVGAIGYWRTMRYMALEF